MKKQLFFMNNQHGFVLPYVLFIITLVFIFVTANTYSYRNDIHITESHLEHVKIETLFQMGREKLKEEIVNLDPSINHLTYNLPEGTVHLSLSLLNEELYELVFTVTTENNSTYNIINYLNLTDETILPE